MQCAIIPKKTRNKERVTSHHKNLQISSQAK